MVEVEGALTYLQYQLNEGAKPASGLQIMRNFEAAAKRAGGTIQGTYPDWCKAYVEYDSRLGNTCTNWGVSMKFVTPGKKSGRTCRCLAKETGTVCRSSNARR